MPLFETPSSWELPTEFPDLSDAKYIGVDVESYDPNLMTKGPGFIRGDARAIGISLATEYGFKTYLPFGHAMGNQLDKAMVVDYVKTQLKRPNQTKVAANFMYDLEALDSLGIEIKGPLADIQVAGPLLNEDQPGGFSLENLAQIHLGSGKTEKLLQEAADNWGIDKKGQMYLLDPKYVGEYAEDDALKTIQVLQKQLPLITNEHLDKVWKLESDLQPVLWKMRKRGIAVDIEGCIELSKEVVLEENALLALIRKEADYNVDPWSNQSLAALFERMGLGYLVRMTEPTKNYPNGQPSFTNDFFDEIGTAHPLCAKLVEYRNTNKMRRDFIEGMIIGQNVNGRLHPQWHQLRADDEDRKNGTSTGRVASSKPNLTQVPARHPRWGKKIRSQFKPDEGGEWCKHDFSSQEPRLTVHFAFIKGYGGAKEARQRYLDDLYTDYHQMTADLIEMKTGTPLDPDKKVARRLAKGINLGSAYGMGAPKMAAQLGIEVEVARRILTAYHEGVPFVKKLEERCIELVHAQGYIRTFLGRKRRFNTWEAKDFKKRTFPIKNKEDAEAMFGDVVRAYAHKALNAMIQGSGADQMKSAIVALDRIGLTPQIQVYDELNQTIYSRDDAWKIKEVMENVLEGLTVPHLADPDVGPSWGEVEELTR